MDVVTVVELHHLSPVREEEEVGEARPVHPHQDICPRRDGDLREERDLGAVPCHSHLEHNDAN